MRSEKEKLKEKEGERLIMIAATLVVFNYLETDEVFALNWGLP